MQRAQTNLRAIQPTGTPLSARPINSAARPTNHNNLVQSKIDVSAYSQNETKMHHLRCIACGNCGQYDRTLNCGANLAQSGASYRANKLNHRGGIAAKILLQSAKMALARHLVFCIMKAAGKTDQ